MRIGPLHQRRRERGGPLRIAIVIALLAAAPPTAANPGDPDRSLSAHGELLLRSAKEGRAIVPVGNALRILVDRPASVLGLLPTGRPDRRLGDRGRMRLPRALGTPRAAVAGPAGSIVVAGYGRTGYALARVTAAGRLDPAFGTRGVKSVTLDPDARVAQLAAAADGSLLVAGGGFVARHRADGSLDAAFGSGGILRTEGFSASLAIASPTGLLFGGRDTASHPRDDTGIVALDAAGARDPAFGTGGRVSLRGGGLGLAAGPGGTVLVVTTSQGDLRIVRLRRDGSLDPAFGGGDGMTSIGRLYAYGATDLLVDPDGAVTVLADYYATDLLLRFTASGRLDRSFGRRGRRGLFDDTYGRADAADLTRDRAGRLVLTGTRFVGGGVEEECGLCREDVAELVSAAIWRFEGGPARVRVTRARRTGRTILAIVQCLRAARVRCRGSVRARGARVRVAVPSGASRTFALRASPRARRVEARIVDAEGRVSTSRRRVR